MPRGMSFLFNLEYCVCVNDNLKAAIHSRWIDEKQPENVGCFKLLRNVITNGARYKREINYRIAMAWHEQHSSERTLFASKFD
jgi:hypothetical protein